MYDQRGEPGQAAFKRRQQDLVGAHGERGCGLSPLVVGDMREDSLLEDATLDAKHLAQPHTVALTEQRYDLVVDGQWCLSAGVSCEHREAPLQVC